METKASAKYIRISPRKARLVVDLIRGRDVGDAQQILDYSPKAAARVVGKILNSAIANAEHNNNLDPDDLYVCRVYVDEGPTLKRFRPRAMGRATRINKRTSHITLVLDEREPRPEAKRRRFRRPMRKKADAEPEVVEGEELEEAEDEEAPEAQRAEANEAELDADTKAEEDMEEAESDIEEEADADEAELDADANADATESPRADADKTDLNADTKAEEDLDEPEEAPEAQRADVDETELNADTKAEEAVTDTKPKRKPKAKKTKETDDSESED